MNRKPYSRDRYSGDTMRHRSRPSETVSRRDQPHSTFQNIGSNIKRSTNSHRNDDDFYHRYDRQNTTQEFESFSDSYKGNGQSHYPETSRHRGNTHSESVKHVYEMDKTQRPSRQTGGSNNREHKSISKERVSSSRNVSMPPRPPARPVEEDKLPDKINPNEKNSSNSDSDEEFETSAKLSRKERKQLKYQAMHKAKIVLYYIMDINVSGGRIPENKHNLFLATWENALQKACPEKIIESSNFSKDIFTIKLVNVDFLPIVQTLVEKLPTLWPDAMFRLIPYVQKRVTMFFPKGSILKSNAEILHILGKENHICTKQWVIGFRTTIEFNDFFILGVDHSSEKHLVGIDHLRFLKSFVSVRLSRADCQNIFGPTKKEMRKVIQMPTKGVKRSEKRTISKALNM